MIEMKDADGKIFGHDFFCVGGVTIYGVIGTRDYDHTTYEVARAKYIAAVKNQEIANMTEQHLQQSTE